MIIRNVRHVMKQTGHGTLCGHVLGAVRDDTRCHVGIDWAQRKAPVESGEQACPTCEREARRPKVAP